VYPINHRQPSHGEIEIAPQIFVPDIPAGRSSTHQSVQKNFPFGEENEQWGDDTSDALCAEVLDIVENAGLCENQGKIYLSIISVNLKLFSFFFLIFRFFYENCRK